jgi:hypothetical protein
MAIRIRGIESLSPSDLDFELQRGARLVLFEYCISIVVLTFRRSSDIYLIRSGESAIGKGLPFTLISLIAGWWGIPWGPIYTVQSLFYNFQDGRDVTEQVRNSLRAPAAPSPRLVQRPRSS